MRKLTVFGMIFGLMLMAVPAASADSTPRPFQGSAVGSVTFIPGTDCQNYGGLNFRTDGFAVGTSSHLGRTVLNTSHCSPEGPDFAGEATLVAANGDEVYIEYSGVNSPPDPDTMIIVSSTTFVIVGGSGRFDGAHGGGTLTAYGLFEGFEDFEWPASWVWEGTISY